MDYFHFLAVINNVTMNSLLVLEHNSCADIFSFLGKYLGVKLLAHGTTSCLTFLGTAKLFSKVIFPFYIGT